MADIGIHAPGVEVKKSCCYFCHQNCGVLAYVKDGEVLKIEAIRTIPRTRAVCAAAAISRWST